jgi:hypothetical protein
MKTKNVSTRRIAMLFAGFTLVTTLVLGLSFNQVGALALGGAAGGKVAAMGTEQRVSSPLKPDWVEAMLDARATALRALLDAHDLESTPQRPQPAEGATDARERVSSPLKPDWVEAMLDARATALRALLDAHDLQSAHSKPR